MLTYKYKKVQINPTKTKRMEERIEWARLITDPAVFGMVNRRGFTDILESKRPDPVSPTGFQAIRLGEYFEQKNTIEHSYRVLPGIGVVVADNESISTRMINVSQERMGVTFRSKVEKTPNATNSYTAIIIEDFNTIAVFSDIGWLTIRQFDTDTPMEDGDSWPNSGGEGSEYLRPYNFNGRLIKFFHFFDPQTYLNPGSPAFYAFEAFIDPTWSEEPFF